MKDDSDPGRVPPHNLSAEESLLGAMLLSRDAIADGVRVLKAGDFYKPAHAHVFDAICGLYAQGEPADPITVAEELRRAGLLDAIGGPGFLVDLQANTPSIGNAVRYASIVEENALLRRLIGVAGEIAEIGYEMPDDVRKAVDRAEALVFEIAQHKVTDSTNELRDLLGQALDRLEMLYEQGDAITGVPTGYADLDELLSGLQPNALYVIGARPSMGKCVAWDTPILDPATGERTTIQTLHHRGVNGEWVQVASLADDGRLVVATPSAFVDDGVRPVRRVRTSLGRTVRTTLTHPFLTPEGWRPLAQLTIGDRIAVPRRLPWFGTERVTGAEIVVLAHVLGCAGLLERGRVLDTVMRHSRDLQIDVIDVLKRHGLWRVDDGDLDLPVAIGRLKREQVELFLERLFAANRGALRADAGRLAFATPSARLALSVQHLLLRLGILARVHPVETRDGRVVQLVEAEAHGRGMAAASPPVIDLRDRVRAPGTTLVETRTDIDVVFDEIVELTDEEPTQVYDLTVPGPHNFVAGDIVVHNTAFALGMATHVAVEEQKPVLFFSLEMGARELTGRILAAEARVDSGKLRTGRLNDQDWTKISKAMGRLDGPLLIDDNPNVSVMEIRAKARREKSRRGELGLIVIDYLQLMSGRSNAENRQVEVSEMSRSLKVLARELEVPVIALSQLSRALELRADKRPMLADLRESGSIEQDADVVMFLYRDEVYNKESADVGVAEVIVAKHRNGPTATKRLAFIGQYTKFANIAKGV